MRIKITPAYHLKSELEKGTVYLVDKQGTGGFAKVLDAFEPTNNPNAIVVSTEFGPIHYDKDREVSIVVATEGQSLVGVIADRLEIIIGAAKNYLLELENDLYEEEFEPKDKDNPEPSPTEEEIDKIEQALKLWVW